MFNVTSDTIFNAIDNNYSGDVLAFLTDFVDYCNGCTTFGTPMQHSPFEEVRYESNAVLCTTCDVLQAMDDCEPAIVEVEEEYDTDSPTVYATRYYRDSETGEVFPECYAPIFVVTRPEKLASLCEYIGVNFCSDFFEE